jgi:hypothetical protein
MRATKPRDFTWIPTDSAPDYDPITTLPWLPRTFAEFQALELENPTRFLGYEVWDLLSPAEYYETVKDWMWNPETGHTPPPQPALTDEFSSSSIATPGARPLPTGPRPLPTVSVPDSYPLVPRAPWMLEADTRTDVEADADWRKAMERLFPPTMAPPPPLPAWRQAQRIALDRPPLPTSPWPPPPWGSSPATEQSHEPDSLSSRRNGPQVRMIRVLDPDHMFRHEPPPAPGPRPLPTRDYDSDDSLESYVSTKSRRLPAPAPRALKESTSSSRSLNHSTPPSSFRGGTAANAFCTVRDPTIPDPLATRSIIVGLDSYSDATVAHRDIAYAYDIHRVAETVQTGAGEATYQEEGLVDIVRWSLFF